MLLAQGRLDYKYFTVREDAMRPGRKCPTFSVLSGQDECIGSIHWYGPWRQFVLSPEAGTVWSKGCLVDVQDALAKIERARREG